MKNSIFTTSLFPTTKEDFFAFVKNLAQILSTDTNNQFRRKPNWLGARVAKALPNKSEDFNINTLLDSFNQLESAAAPFDATVWVDSYKGDLESFIDTTNAKKEQMLNVLIESMDSCKELTVIEDKDEDGFHWSVFYTDDEGDVAEIHASHNNPEDAYIDAVGMAVTKGWIKDIGA